MSFHARRGDLDAEQISVAVDDQTGEPVALTVAETVVRYVEQTFAQFPGPQQTLAEQVAVQRLVGAAADDARGDERGGIDVGRAQFPASRIADDCVLAGSRSPSEETSYVHLVAENPEMPRPEAGVPRAS